MGKLQVLKTAARAPPGARAQSLPGAGAFTDPDRGSSTARGYGWAWQKLRRRILERDGHRCQCTDCKASGALLPAHEVDHRVPKALGGADDLDNLQAINRDCHRRKSQAEAAAGRLGPPGL